MRTLLACFCLSIAMLHANTARAQIIGHRPPYECQHSDLYNAGASTNAPAMIIAALAGPGAGLEFRTCNDGQNNIHFFLREPHPNQAGVCRIAEREIFPASPADMVWFATPFGPNSSTPLKGWSYEPPSLWKAGGYKPIRGELAQVTGVTCPSSSDANYLAVRHVTDGMLKSFVAAWHKAAASPDAFDRAFASAELRDGATPKLKAELRDAALAGNLRIGDISCSDEGCRASMVPNDIAIIFDVGRDGIVFTGLAPIYEI